ncbi:MAG TPA: choice-of-anchor D domain-containing protein, partial [Gammaproteobacteria bacterium]|nr:choice-of-anchor D domain-containing protein [Gammaproteobacteria bacterium]
MESHKFSYMVALNTGYQVGYFRCMRSRAMVDISASCPQPGGGQRKHEASAGGVLRHVLAASIGLVFAGQVAAAGCPAGTTATGDNLIPDGDFKVAAPTWDTDYPFKGVVTDGLSPFPEDDGAVIVNGSWENAAGAQAPLTAGGSWWYTNGNTTTDSMTVWEQEITGLDADKTYAFTVNYTNVIDPTKDKGGFVLEVPILQIQVNGADQLAAPISVEEGDDADEWFSVDVEVSGSETATLTILDLFKGPNPLGDDLGIAGLNLQECQSDATDPAISVSDDLDFGTITIGETGEEAITVTNTGDLDLEIDKVTVKGKGFDIDAADCLDNSPLAKGDTCDINVTFTPTKVGDATGSVSIASNDPENATTSVGLAGTATEAPVGVLDVTPASLDFPNTIVGERSEPIDITVSNIGTAELELDDPLAVSGLEGFQLDTTDCDGKTLAVADEAGDSCIVTATFEPTSTGDIEETATITAAGLSSEVVLTGTATEAPSAALLVTPDSIDFPSTIVSESSEPVDITVSNVGTAELELDDPLTVTGLEEFQLDTTGCDGKTLAVADEAGDSCIVTATFEPTKAGDSEETATIITGEFSSDVVLTGTATDTPESAVDLSSVGQDGITIPAEVGQPESKVIAVGNSGTGPLEITDVIAPDDEQFEIDAGDCIGTPVAPGETCDIEVTFTPTAEGTFEDKITIESNAPSSPTDVPVIGVGVNGAKDSDGDGIPDLDELRIGTDPEEADTDGDGIDDGVEIGANPDSPKDTDDDTIIDALESNIVDTDTDGRFNFNDTDDDNDGILTREECSAKLTATCADVDNGKTGKKDNGVPDYLEPKSAVLGEGDEKPDVEKKVLTDLDGGVGAAGLPLLGLLGAGAWFRRRRAAIAVATAIGGVALSTSPVQAKQGQFYVGAGIGQSMVEPDPNGTGYSLDDDTDNAGKLFLGFDLNDYLSLEAYYADLGGAVLSLGAASDTIDYTAYGVDALLHFPGSLPGLAGFLKLGAGKLETDSDTIPFSDVENTQITGGAGVEYQFSNGVSVRGEYNYLDNDAQMITLNLLKRFGGAAPPPPPPPEPEPEPEPEPVVVVTPPPPPPPAPVDSDGDGVLDPLDKCPDTAAGIQVDGS